MKIYSDQFLNIYFGDAQAQLTRDQLMNSRVGDSLCATGELAQVKELLSIGDIFVLRQEHGVQGVTITAQSSETLRGAQLVGDFLITDVPQRGLLVYTADCLPLVIYDPVAHAVGLCHAGWRGSVSRVACVMLHEMMTAFGTDPRYVRAFLDQQLRYAAILFLPTLGSSLKGCGTRMLFLTSVIASSFLIW